MAYQIEITRNGKTKLARNPINRQPHQFNDLEHAQTFAAGMLRTWKCDDRNWGRRAATYRVIEA